jgi:hypothetical protein
MAESMSDSEMYALEYLYGGDDVEIECHSMAWVITRYPQKCVSILHKGPMTQPAGSRMVLERAKVEGKFGSCYTCESCVARAKQELKIGRN